MTTPTILEEFESEAYKTLLARVGRKSPKIPADLLVRHVLGIVPAGEWPVRVEAMDAVLRRLDSVKKDGLRIDRQAGRRLAARPLCDEAARARAPGPIARRSSGVDPIEARCDCPDFLKNSLGVCKHVLVVLEHLHDRPKLLKRAMERARAVTRPRPALGPDPAADGPRRLARSRDLVRPLDARPSEGDREARALEWFRPGRAATWSLERLLSRATRRSAWTWSRTCSKLLPPGERRPAGPRARRPARGRARPAPAESRKRALDPAEIQRGASRGLKRTLYPYQKEGVERFLGRGPAAPGRRHGPGQDGPGDLLHRHPLAKPADSQRPDHRPGQPQAAVGPRVGQLLRPADPGRRRLARRAQASSTSRRKSGLFIINYEQLIRDLEIDPPWAPDLVVLDEAQRIKNWATKTALSVKGLDAALSAGPDRHADGEPDRGAGLGRRVGRRHGARAEVAARRPARDPRRRPQRGHRRPQPRHPPRAAPRRACSGGSARTSSTSSRRGPTPASRSR